MDSRETREGRSKKGGQINRLGEKKKSPEGGGLENEGFYQGEKNRGKKGRSKVED